LTSLILVSINLDFHHKIYYVNLRWFYSTTSPANTNKREKRPLKRLLRDRQTDRQTDRQSDRDLFKKPCCKGAFAVVADSDFQQRTDVIRFNLLLKSTRHTHVPLVVSIHTICTVRNFHIRTVQGGKNSLNST